MTNSTPVYVVFINHNNTQKCKIFENMPVALYLFLIRLNFGGLVVSSLDDGDDVTGEVMISLSSPSYIDQPETDTAKLFWCNYLPYCRHHELFLTGFHVRLLARYLFEIFALWQRL